MIDWKRFEKTDTEILIDYCQNSDGTESLRKDAFLALCFRFRKDLLNKCEIICKNRGHSVDVAREITENTFKKYEKSRSFKFEKGKQNSIEHCFLIYLYKIAKNELCNYYHLEQKKKDGKLYDGTEKIVIKLPNINIEKLDSDQKIIHQNINVFTL